MSRILGRLIRAVLRAVQGMRPLFPPPVAGGQEHTEQACTGTGRQLGTREQRDAGPLGLLTAFLLHFREEEIVPRSHLVTVLYRLGKSGGREPGIV